MNTPKHVDPAAPVKVGWGTAATLTLAAIAVLALVAWGGTWLRGDHGAPAADGGQPAVVAAASASASRQLAACRHELTLGDAVAAAADASHRDWGSHVQAQLQLDQGKFTLAQTLALWASSKKPGPSDVRAFTTARAAWAKAPGACQTMATTTTTADRADAAACMARRAAVQAVVATGADVNAQWAAHLQMMADKAHTDAASYSQRWRQMVQQAPATLKAYEQARSRLAAAPRCGG